MIKNAVIETLKLRFKTVNYAISNINNPKAQPIILRHFPHFINMVDDTIITSDDQSSVDYIRSKNLYPQKVHINIRYIGAYLCNSTDVMNNEIIDILPEEKELSAYDALILLQVMQEFFGFMGYVGHAKFSGIKVADRKKIHLTYTAWKYIEEKVFKTGKYFEAKSQYAEKFNDGVDEDIWFSTFPAYFIEALGYEEFKNQISRFNLFVGYNEPERVEQIIKDNFEDYAQGVVELSTYNLYPRNIKISDIVKYFKKFRPEEFYMLLHSDICKNNVVYIQTAKEAAYSISSKKVLNNEKFEYLINPDEFLDYMEKEYKSSGVKPKNFFEEQFVLAGNDEIIKSVIFKDLEIIKNRLYGKNKTLYINLIRYIIENNKVFLGSTVDRVAKTFNWLIDVSRGKPINIIDKILTSGYFESAYHVIRLARYYEDEIEKDDIRKIVETSIEQLDNYIHSRVSLNNVLNEDDYTDNLDSMIILDYFIGKYFSKREFMDNFSKYFCIQEFVDEFSADSDGRKVIEKVTKELPNIFKAYNHDKVLVKKA